MNSPFSAAKPRKMKPTLKHRPALWENMLGTVWARNDSGETKYFDYDWEAALRYCGALEEGRDPRLARCQRGTYRQGMGLPRPRQWVLYVVHQVPCYECGAGVPKGSGAPPPPAEVVCDDCAAK